MRSANAQYDNELTHFGVDDGVSESAALQGRGWTGLRTGRKHRDGDRVVPLPADDGGEEETLRRREVN